MAITLKKPLPLTLLLGQQIVLKRIFSKRIGKLSKKAFWKGGIYKTGTFWPFITGQVIGTKKFVDERKDNGKVIAIMLGFLAMVPMVVLRCSDNVF